MNKIYLYLFAAICGCLTIGCDDENYQLYDAGQLNQIYFGVDSVNFIYGAREDQDYDVEIPIKLIGMADLDGDAAFEVVVDGYESTAKAGMHYHLAEKQYFMKDSVTAVIRIDLDKKALVKDVTYTLILRIGTNEKYGPANTKKCVVTFGDTYIAQPGWWLPDRLGSYTQEKLVMFISCFRSTKEITPVLYEAIELNWGEYLDNLAADRYPYLLTTYTYVTYFKQYFYTPIYEYYLATGDERYAIPDPALLP